MVVCRYREWKIACDISIRRRTRIRAAFSVKSDLRLKIYRPLMFGYLAKSLGGLVIQSGDYQFDSQFVIKGNHPQKVQQLLDDQPLKEQIHLNSVVEANGDADLEYWFMRLSGVAPAVLAKVWNLRKYFH